MKNKANQFKTMDTKISKQKDTLSQIVLTILLSISIAAMPIVLTAYYLIQNEYRVSLEKTQQNIKSHTFAKSIIFENQNYSLFNYANSIVNSDTIKLLLADYNIDHQNEIFNAQKPYIQRTLQEFVEFNDDIVNARLNVNNNELFSYSDYNFIKPENIIFTHKKDRAISSPILENNKVFVDVAINIKDLNDGENQKFVGQLIYRLDITSKLIKILRKDETSIDGSQLTILGHGKELVLNQINFAYNNLEPIIKSNKFISYDLLLDVNKSKFIYISKENDFGYKIKVSYSIKDALKEYNTFKQNCIIYSIMLTMLFTLFVLAAFWRSKNNKTRVLAKQYATFAKEINKKQTMLESINKTIDEQITLKDLNGKYVYANKAFIKFFNIKNNLKSTNLDDVIISKKLSDILNKADSKVTKTSKPWSKEQVEITNETGARFFDITKWPQKDGENVTGVITIARDRTEPILHQKEMEKMQNQAIEALVKTVEIKDPHLAGHHARIAYIASELSKKLKLSNENKLTLDYSARLSGIGKVFVPQALLTKPGKLTNDELEIVQTHVIRAKEVLNNIDFSLPITDTISNMYERLDGSGYPNALTSEQIGKLPRILAISDAFCALIVPRSYRDSIDFNEAVKLLESQHGKYDPEILITLGDIVNKMSSVKKEFIINLS